MHVMKVEVDYSDLPEPRRYSFTRQEWEQLLRDAPGAGLPSWDEIEAGRNAPEEEKYRRYWYATGLATMGEVAALSEFGFERIRVSRVRGLYSSRDPADILAAAQGGCAHTRIDITVPGGVALTNIARVTWLEDCCTQHLQKQLEAGWRIIAVCPPNDARRPTYILGHTDPNAREVI